MQENLQQPVHTFNFAPGSDKHRPPAPRTWMNNGLQEVERRRARRYQIQGRLLSVCAYYAGQILDISRTGLAFQIVYFLKEAGGKADGPLKSDTLDILSPGLTGYFFRDLPVQTVCDLSLGQLYPENDAIIAYRRSVRLAEPLRKDQLLSLQRYLGGCIHEVAPANHFS